MKVFVVGTAGSGKSTLVKEFGAFLRSKDYDVMLVNLDPASDPIYHADLDIRKFVKTEEVMARYKLGINGALLKSTELMLNFVDDFRVSADFVLYDTPGQMELFVYSESGIEFVHRISDRFTAGIFMLDSTMVKTPENFISAILQNVVVSLRLSIPTIAVFSKNDLFEIDIEKVIKELKLKSGVLAELMEKLVPVLDYSTVKHRPIKISSLKKTGFEDLLSALRELFCACGDLS
ncbi:MAG: ATP/GTP-binding protein [Archaeoglobaceae archaeon]